MALPTDNMIWRVCEVRQVIDDQAGLRIKARLKREDLIHPTDDDLPFCFPLLPKLMHINPKVGETVLVTTAAMGETEGIRFFIGPIISQAYFNSYDPYHFSSRSLFPGEKLVAPLPNPDTNPANRGTLPDREDVAIQGRGNSDIVLMPEELRLRCGFKKNPIGGNKNSLEYNKVDLGYIQMRYHRLKDKRNNEFKSVINMVADRINLLSHDSPVQLNLTDPDKLITDEEMQKILDQCHPLIYGDTFIDFMKGLIKVFKEHTHPMSMDPPVFKVPDKNLLATDLDLMLSKSVRCN